MSVRARSAVAAGPCSPSTMTRSKPAPAMSSGTAGSRSVSHVPSANLPIGDPGVEIRDERRLVDHARKSSGQRGPTSGCRRVSPDRTAGALCATRHHPAERASRARPCRPYDAGPTALRRSARGSRPDRRARDLEHPLLRAVVPALAVLREDARRPAAAPTTSTTTCTCRATTPTRSRSTGRCSTT